jgi:hypothetical protein
MSRRLACQCTPRAKHFPSPAFLGARKPRTGRCRPADPCHQLETNSTRPQPQRRRAGQARRDEEQRCQESLFARRNPAGELVSRRGAGARSWRRHSTSCALLSAPPRLRMTHILPPNHGGAFRFNRDTGESPHPEDAAVQGTLPARPSRPRAQAGGRSIFPILPRERRAVLPGEGHPSNVARHASLGQRSWRLEPKTKEPRIKWGGRRAVDGW